MQMFVGDKLCQAFQMTSDGKMWITGSFMTGMKEPLTPFRHFRLRVDSVNGTDRWSYATGYCMQFSRIEFVDGAGTLFDYPVETFASVTNVGGAAGSEDVKNCLDHSAYTKVCLTDCFTNAAEPVYVAFDLKTDCLDLARFTKWQWWTANDTSGYPNRNLKTYQLQVSHDGIEWLVADTQTDGHYITSNYSLAYEGEIAVSR